MDESKQPGRRRPSGAPWGRMLRSPAVLAIIVNNFTFHYALYILMNWMPTYFSELLGALKHEGSALLLCPLCRL